MIAPNRRRIFVRIIPIGLFFLLSITLLSYSIYFLYYFQANNSVTSYFPWRWHDFYNESSAVLKLFYLGLGSSSALLITSFAIFYFFVWRGRSRINILSSSTSATSAESSSALVFSKTETT